jgi:ataxin-3
MPVSSMRELKEREEMKDKMTGDHHDDDVPKEALEMPADGERLPTNFHGIYHEKQIGALCAVHALNNLVQARWFDEVQLAEIGRDMDRREAALLEAPSATHESQNVRSDGFFSIQVILQALQRAGLSCDQMGSPSQREPGDAGYIFNRREHWFALRRIGDRHWFDLNSMSKTPQEMSPAHVDLFLQAHFEKGYSVFSVRGAIPDHPLARDAGALAAAVAACAPTDGRAPAPAKQATQAFSGAGRALAPSALDVDPALAAAAAADPELAAAIAASMEDVRAKKAKTSAADDKDAIRRARLARFG